MNIFIGGAWPYANGSLHIGQIAALLPGDILARYFRLKGEKVCYVSGSDCHGTPIQLKAKKEGITPASIADRYHSEFSECFKRLGFSYDLYNRTDDQFHKDFVQDFFLDLNSSGYLYKKRVDQAYCNKCIQFLPDRFVVGFCPHCGSIARGDQCDTCGSLLDPTLLNERKCSICGESPVFNPSEHFFLSLSKLEPFICAYLGSAKGWRINAVNLSQRYVLEGLKDRAVTRDLELGIDVPVYGFEGKKIYVWVEAVLGYLSASKKWALQKGKDWEGFWNGDCLHYYVHGKDNIPFHSIILPALLEAHGDLHFPDKIISSEYLTLEGRKISTSQNWAIWVPYILENYDPDSIRYFLISNGPEKRDTDFSWREFINSHNGELLGAYGNFVNRTLVFLQKSFASIIPQGKLNSAISNSLIDLFPRIGSLIEQGSFKDSLDSIFSFIRSVNKYFDEEQPWVSVSNNIEKCKDTLYTCVQIISNLSILLEPFLPFSSYKVRGFLNIDKFDWGCIKVEGGSEIKNIERLFERIDKKVIEEEEQKLKG